MAVADPMLQRDAPLPASAVRRRAGHRQHWLYRRAGPCQRPIARPPVRPVLIANTKCVAAQKRAEPRAVAETLTSVELSAFHHQTLHEHPISPTKHLIYK